MSLHNPSAETDDPYYECSDCGYTSPAAVAIGLCPVCGDDIRGPGAVD